MQRRTPAMAPAMAARLLPRRLCSELPPVPRALTKEKDVRRRIAEHHEAALLGGGALKGLSPEELACRLLGYEQPSEALVVPRAEGAPPKRTALPPIPPPSLTLSLLSITLSLPLSRCLSLLSLNLVRSASSLALCLSIYSLS